MNITTALAALWWIVPVVLLLLGYRLVLRLFGVVLVPQGNIGIVNKRNEAQYRNAQRRALRKESLYVGLVKWLDILLICLVLTVFGAKYGPINPPGSPKPPRPPEKLKTILRK